MAILPTLQIGGMQLLHMEHDDLMKKQFKVNRFVVELFLLYVFYQSLLFIVFYKWNERV